MRRSREKTPPKKESRTSDVLRMDNKTPDSRQKQSRPAQSRISINSIDKSVISQVQETPQHALQIQLWHQRMRRHSDDQNMELESSTVGFIVKIEQLHGISYHPKETTSRISIKLSANVFNSKSHSFYVRTYESAAMLLQETKNRKNQYHLMEPSMLLVYSYEMLHEQIQLHFEFQAIQHKSSKVITNSYIGAFKINPFGASRGQIRESIKNSVLADGHPTGGIVMLSISRSQSMKPLFKLIPPHCICGREDEIPGLVGNRLPQMYNFLRIEYTSGRTLKMQLLSLEIPSSITNQMVRIAEGYCLSRCNSPPELSISGWCLKLTYHNGWKSVSSCIVNLESKREVDLRSRTSVGKAISYEATTIGVLPMVFTEAATVFCIQLLVKIAVGGKYRQTLQFAIANHCSSLLDFRDDIQRYHFTLRGGPYDSISNILPQLHSLHPIKIEYDLHLSQISQQPVNLQDSLQIPSYDRMEIEKSRILKQKKQLKWQKRKLQMEHTEEPRKMDVSEAIEQTYKTKLNAVKRQRDMNLEKLQQLKKKLEIYGIEESDEENQQQEIKTNRLAATKAVYFKNALQPFNSLKKPTNIPTVLTGQFPSEAIIKTELSQYTSSSWIIFNFISITTESHKIPRRLSFLIHFYNLARLKSREMEVNLETGELSHLQYDEKVPDDKHPLYTLKVQPSEYRPRDNYLRFLTYIQNNKLQLVIHDEADMEFGYALVNLTGIMRRRRQEMKMTIETEIFLRDVVKGILKVQVTNMRQPPQKPITYEEKVNIRAMSPEQDKLVVVSNRPMKEIDQIQQFKIQITGEHRLKQRIENLKKKNGIASQESTQRQMNKIRVVDRVVQDRILQQKTICPVYHIPEIFFVDFSNPYAVSTDFRVIISDSDEQYVDMSELQVIFSKEQALSWLIENKQQNYQQSNIRDLQQDSVFTLAKTQKICLVFHYVTARKFRTDITTQREMRKCNTKRIICISIVSGEMVCGIYRIHIRPQRDLFNLRLNYYAGHSEVTTLILPPFLPPNEDKKLQIDFTNPNLSFSWPQNNQLSITLTTPAITELITQTQFDMIVYDEEKAGRVLSIWNIRVLNCQKIIVNGKMGAQSQTMIRLSHNQCSSSTPIAIYSEDEKVVMPMKPTKAADGGIMFKITVSPNFVGCRLFYMKLVNPSNQEIIHEMLIEVNSQQPTYKSTFKVSIKRDQPNLQDLFEFTNPLPRKTRYTMVSSNPYLLRPENPQFEVAANKPFQFKLIFLAPITKINESEITLSFTDREEQVREFFLFRIVYT